MSEILLEARNLKKHFPVKGGFFQGTSAWVHAVDGVDFELAAGTTLALVGETGCGKSTTGRLVLRLLEPTEGEVLFRGVNLASLSRRAMMDLRKEMQIIFQDPFSSLNPRLSIRQTVGEPLLLHGKATRHTVDGEVIELLRRVGLKEEDRLRYPHEFSGGQRQRVGIARALALKPKLIVADEPVSSLDVSVQAQVVNLLLDLQDEYRLTYIFISHDLSLVEHISDSVAVMYLGKIVENGPVEGIYGDPRHPYTEALLASIPAADPELRSKKNAPLTGDIPSPITPPPGCPFHPRCPVKIDICTETFPARSRVGPGHTVSCHLKG